jgi:hypothetical protein
MQIVTPHAVATVLGTQFRLTVSPNDTLLEVTKGRVELANTSPGNPILVAANESGLATAGGGLDFRAVKWPENADALVFGLDPFTRIRGVFRSAESGELFFAEFEGRGGATLYDFQARMELIGGYFLDAAGGRDVTALCQSADALTLEIVLLPAGSQAADEAIIVSLAGDDSTPNLELAQIGNELTFALRSDEAGPSQAIRFPLTATVHPLHLTITFADGELVAYRDGAQVARQAADGSLAAWTPGSLAIGADANGRSPWHGSIEAIAIHSRRLDAGEVAQNVLNYRTLAHRP